MRAPPTVTLIVWPSNEDVPDGAGAPTSAASQGLGNAVWAIRLSAGRHAIAPTRNHARTTASRTRLSIVDPFCGGGGAKPLAGQRTTRQDRCPRLRGGRSARVRRVSRVSRGELSGQERS